MQPSDANMHVVAIISQKGGAGKTTLAIHLAAAAQAAKFESVIFDTDPQATAVAWAEWRMRAEMGGPEVIDCASPPLLARKLELAKSMGAEFVVIDTPPAADLMARSAGKVADLVLIPCRPQAFDLAAVEATADLARASGKPCFVVWVGGPPQRAPLTYQSAAELVEEIGLAIAPVMLSHRAVFYHSTGAGKVASEIEPGGKAAGEVAALWQWVGLQVGMPTRRHADIARAA